MEKRCDNCGKLLCKVIEQTDYTPQKQRAVIEVRCVKCKTDNKIMI